MARRTPGGRTITLTTASTVYNLYTLLAAVDTTFTLPKKCSFLQLQCDLAAGAAKVYEGDATSVSSTDMGAVLVAGQVLVIGPFESNLIRMDDIGLTSDTNTTKVEVLWVTR